jgi:serine-type D-Ala-D-Ala carboxypeptidase (penicillin-binding protein 5/6)
MSLRSVSGTLARNLLVVIFTSAALTVAAVAPPIPAPPALPVNAYVLVDFESGHVLASRDPDARVEPASITKLMTTFVAFHELAAGRLQMEDEATVSTAAWRAEGSRMFIEERSRVSIEDLLSGVIIQSGNDASIALAEHIAGTEAAFAQIMNTYAQHLGMDGTNFVNSTGLPHPDHYTTANDIALLSAALIRDFPQYYPMFSIREFTYNDIRQHNRNALLFRDDSVDGLKTGHTESAGYCLAASALRGEQRLISVVLGAEDESSRNRASSALLDYGFRWFETHLLYPVGAEVTRIQVWKGSVDEVALGPEQDVHITIPRGRYAELSANMELVTQVMAPVDVDSPIGEVVVMLGNEVVARVALVPLASVPEGNLWQVIRDSVALWFQ